MSCEGKELHRLSQHDLRKALIFHRNRIGQPLSKGYPKVDHKERVNELQRVVTGRKASSYMLK